MASYKAILQFHVVVVLLLFDVVSSSSHSTIVEGACSLNVSGDPKSVPASIIPIRFSACWSGRLVWSEPYGGIELTFNSGVPMTTLGTYQVCLTAKDYGTNIFTRKGNAFKTVRRYDDKNTESEICVISDTKEITVNLESTDMLRTETAVFTYRTSFKRKNSGPLLAKECKLCGQRELIRSFCGGDFAVHGYVKSIIPISDGRKRGEAVVVAKKVLHQSVKIFEKSPNGAEILGNVNFPLYCHWKKHARHGYLLTGKLKAGDGPIIHCRIRFHLWRELYHANICDGVAVQT